MQPMFSSQAEWVIKVFVLLFCLHSKSSISSYTLMDSSCSTAGKMHGGSWQGSTEPRVCGGAQSWAWLPRQSCRRCCGQEQEWLHSRGVERGAAPAWLQRWARQEHQGQGGVEVCVLAKCPGPGSLPRKLQKREPGKDLQNDLLTWEA